MLNGLLYHNKKLKNIPRSGIVHRLDKNTSGLIIISKTIKSYKNLINQFKLHKIKKNYIALVWGKIEKSGIINKSIIRNPYKRICMSVTSNEKGKNACTHFKRINFVKWKKYFISAVYFNLITGRTHQIRVHCSYIGHPIIGDNLYCKKYKKINLPIKLVHHALHAFKIKLIHPYFKKTMKYSINLPNNMLKISKIFGLSIFNKKKHN